MNGLRTRLITVFAVFTLLAWGIFALAFVLNTPFWGLFGAIVLASLAALWIAKWLQDGFAELSRLSSSLTAGDFSARTLAMSKDEFGQLGRALDTVAQGVEARLAELNVEEARLRTVLDSMVEAVFVTDRDGKIRLSNAALSKLAGSLVEGRTAIAAIRNTELHEAVLAGLNGKELTVEIEVRTLRETRWLSAQIAPLPNRAGVVVVMHDVTDLKNADRVRRDFVANASHELRTPLTAIRGFAETLRDGALEDPATAKKFLETILDHTKRLERLTGDLLELSKIESRTDSLDVGPVDLCAAAARALRGLGPQASERKLHLEMEVPSDPVIVSANEAAVDHILVNLIDNAIKYTPEEGRVRVRVTPAIAIHAAIEVIDTGPGIAPQHLPRIFERFYRVDPGRARVVGGTGLGLAIVKHLVQRMGGEIAVESRVGTGTTFRIRLPVTRPPPGRHGNATV